MRINSARKTRAPTPQGPQPVARTATEPQTTTTFEFNAALSTAVKRTGPIPFKKKEVRGPLAPDLLEKMHHYWQAANYLTVGQIYLSDNPLLKEPLRPQHIKPRLLGHWGTSTGQNFIYVHLNRLIKKFNADIIYIAGPGHGGPTLNAHSYLEGTYSEVYPTITQDASGMQPLFREFSTPGGVPSHCGPHVPSSLHEGGELGYSPLYGFGAVFDNPDLIVACVVGDGEAETCPLEGSWKGIKFLNPKRDGAVRLRLPKAKCTGSHWTYKQAPLQIIRNQTCGGAIFPGTVELYRWRGLKALEVEDEAFRTQSRQEESKFASVSMAVNDLVFPVGARHVVGVARSRPAGLVPHHSI